LQVGASSPLARRSLNPSAESIGDSRHSRGRWFRADGTAARRIVALPRARRFATRQGFQGAIVWTRANALSNPRVASPPRVSMSRQQPRPGERPCCETRSTADPRQTVAASLRRRAVTNCANRPNWRRSGRGATRFVIGWARSAALGACRTP
jgi:hypothetical protein